MLAKMCDWTGTGKGKLICSFVATVGAVGFAPGCKTG